MPVPVLENATSILPQLTDATPSTPEPEGLCYEGTVLVHRGISLPRDRDILEELRDERFEYLCEGLPR